MRCTFALLGWLIAVLAAEHTPTDPGHFFIPVGKTYPSYSSWAVTITVNMAPYRQRIREIVGLEEALTAFMNNTSMQPYLNSSSDSASLALYASQLNDARVQMDREITSLHRTFRDVLYPPKASDPFEPRVVERSQSPRRTTREKRGLIDGIGNAFNTYSVQRPRVK